MHLSIRKLLVLGLLTSLLLFSWMGETFIRFLHNQQALNKYHDHILLLVGFQVAIHAHQAQFTEDLLLSKEGGKVPVRRHSPDFRLQKQQLTNMALGLPKAQQQALQQIISRFYLLVEKNMAFQSEMLAKWGTADLNSEWKNYLLDQNAPISARLQEELAQLIAGMEKAHLAALAEQRKTKMLILLQLGGLGLVGLFFTALGWSFFHRKWVMPLRQSAVWLSLMKGGDLALEKADRGKGIAMSDLPTALGELVAQVHQYLQQLAQFGKSLADGNDQASYTMQGPHDTPGHILCTLQQKIAKGAREEKQRAWANDGYAQVVNILRQYGDHSEKLGPPLIASLVERMGAVMGGLFMVQLQGVGEPFLELIGCYAWSRHKMLQKRVAFGEGLAGEAWRDGDTLIVTDIPEAHFQLETGLGPVMPGVLVAMPLKIDQTVVGVLELATYQEPQPHEMALLERLSETMAFTLSNLRERQHAAL